MFGVDTSELVLVAVLALIFIGPKDLPNALRTVGRWVGQVRGMARHFQSGIDAMIREAELEEMERKWREENERIMSQFPSADTPAAVVAEPALQEAPPAPPVDELPEAPARPDEQLHLPPEKRELP